MTLPYKIGILTGAVSAAVSLPLVFHLDTCFWFNELYVTTDVPVSSDLDTMLEVGSWAWNWMEPPLGTVSFVLLALQFSRAQMMNIGIKPYTGFMVRRRVENLQAEFPKYDPAVLEDFAKEHSPLKGD